MRRELRGAALAIMMLGMTSGCRQSEPSRARAEAKREQEREPVRESATVKRVTTPQDSGRILYDAPSNLSARDERP